MFKTILARHTRVCLVLVALGSLTTMTPVTGQVDAERRQDVPDDETELRVPAFTAYMLPDPEGARISERRGITRWVDPHQSVNWYGRFERTGDVSVQVSLALPADVTRQYSFSVGGVSRQAEVTGRGLEAPVIVDLGSFPIQQTGYQRLTLSVADPEAVPTASDAAGASAGAGPDTDAQNPATATTLGNIQALLLRGSAIQGAHFNLKERRNAASVHLVFPVEPAAEVTAFYSEVTATEDPTMTFYMACGWHRGYFGMQVNSPTERRIIFSVWDSGDEAVDRDRVEAANRVTLVGKGDGVYSSDFGNEGTGGHSHLKYLWRTGTKQRFVVTAEPTDATHTIFAGYWFHPEQQQWMLISAWKAPHEGGYLKGLHSFSENFGGSNGHLLRLAQYGNQWIRWRDGSWHELTAATFSHDPTGRADRLDRSMGVSAGQFFLRHGGFGPESTDFGTRFERPPSGEGPPSPWPPTPLAPSR